MEAMNNSKLHVEEVTTALIERQAESLYTSFGKSFGNFLLVLSDLIKYKIISFFIFTQQVAFPALLAPWYT